MPAFMFYIGLFAIVFPVLGLVSDAIEFFTRR